MAEFEKFGDDEQISINMNYKGPPKKNVKTIDCTKKSKPPSKKQSEAKKKRFNNAIKKERELVIDAIIVRQMKF